MIKNEMRKIIEKAVKGVSSGDGPILVEIPKDIKNGDYSTNIALALSKKLGKNPVEIAKEIVGSIKKPEFLENIEVAAPGFINFYLSKEVFVENVEGILKDKNFGKNPSSRTRGVHYGASNNLKNQKVIIEYTDPNILKEFHIGHLMSNAIGESLSRILEFSGAKIKRVCYQSDVGLGIAKAVFGKMQQPDLLWQSAYVLGTKMYDEDATAKEAITKLNKKIFERSDKAVNKVYDEGKKWSLAHFEKIYRKLGTKFDSFIFESEVAPAGKKTVEKGLLKGIFETGEKGAIVFKGENYGLHTRVFINSEGLPTYEAKELALAKIKYDTYRYDQSVIITGNEVNEYFKVLMAAMSQIFPDLCKKTTHIGHGMMRLPEGKMSSRTGNIVTFEFLLREVEKLVAKKVADRDMPQQEKEKMTENVAMGAIKYSILRQSIGSDIIYDFEKSISFEGDSGPYLQYSYARANSVLRKAKQETVKASLKKVPVKIGQLEKMMWHFPEVIEKAGAESQPHIIVLYLTELAREFNNYYAHNKIVDTTDEFSPYNVALTQAFSLIMKNGLWLLGIEAPEKM